MKPFLNYPFIEDKLSIMTPKQKQENLTKVLKKSEKLLSETMPNRLPMTSTQRWDIENKKHLKKQ